jgi:hypothetical protein
LIPNTGGDLSFYHHIQAGSGAHPGTYPVGTRGSFHRGKRLGQDTLHLLSKVKEGDIVQKTPEAFQVPQNKIILIYNLKL